MVEVKHYQVVLEPREMDRLKKVFDERETGKALKMAVLHSITCEYLQKARRKAEREISKGV